MRRLKYYFAVVILLMSSCITGCSKQYQIDDPVKNSSLAISHFYKEVRDGFLIDAAVTGVQEGSIPSVYRAEPMIFSSSEINDFLIHISDSVLEAEEEIGPYWISYSGICSSGSNFYRTSSASKESSYSHFGYIHHENAKYYLSYPIYNGQYDYDDSSSSKLAHLFMDPKVFSFASATEAEQNIRQALDALGLHDLYLNRILYLDHMSMALAENILQEEDWSFIKEGSYPVKESWREADDGYMFEFFCTLDGLQLSYRQIERDTAVNLGCSIMVWYQESGITWLSIDNAWRITEKADTPDKIVPPAEALELAVNKLCNIVTYQNVVVDTVSLEYVYFQSNSEWLLKPMWIIGAQYETKWTSDMKFREYVLVDAITGMEY